jgi:hypothetical protein
MSKPKIKKGSSKPPKVEPKALPPKPSSKPPKPPPMSEYAKRVAKHRAEVQATLAKNREIAAKTVKAIPPVKPEDLLDSTRIEGKQVSTWAKEIEKLEDKAESLRKLKPGTLPIIDLTILPGWAVWAVEQWKARGRPTKNDRIKIEIELMLEKADKLERFATLDRKKGTEAGMEANIKGIKLKEKKRWEETRDKKLAAANAKEAEAKGLREQAQKMLDAIKD